MYYAHCLTLMVCRLVSHQNLFFFLIVRKKRWRGAFWVGIRLDNYDLVAWKLCLFLIPICLNLLIFLFFWIIQGREDDNIDTIRKRFKVFLESSLPVIEYYNSKGKVRKVMIYLVHLTASVLAFHWCHWFCFHPQIDAAKPIEEVFEAVKAVFSPLHEKVKHRSSAPWSFDQWFLWRIKYGQELSRSGCSISWL